MQVYSIKQNQNGSVLVLVLIFVFVLTAIVVSDCQNLIVNQKMQHVIQHDFIVFLRAEAGMQQTIFALQGKSVQLADSKITLKTQVKTITIDQCGNQTVEIESIAEDDFDKVVLNSRDIFARVPIKKHCPTIPLHRCLWWRVRALPLT